jgi:hypothetical protein
LPRQSLSKSNSLSTSLIQLVVQRQGEDFRFQRIESNGFGNRRKPTVDRNILPFRQACPSSLQRHTDLAPVANGNATARGVV